MQEMCSRIATVKLKFEPKIKRYFSAIPQSYSDTTKKKDPTTFEKS